MGFPAGYTELLLPKLLINTLFLLSLIRNLISALLRTLGLSDFLDPDIRPEPESTAHNHHHHQPTTSSSPSVSATLIREMLPTSRFGDIATGSGRVPESCAVCLYEFEEDDEIRRLRNCTHVFHRSCVDRWIDHDRKTCPLCRTSLVPDELQEAFNQSIWAASGIPEFYSEYAPITNF